MQQHKGLVFIKALDVVSRREGEAEGPLNADPKGLDERQVTLDCVGVAIYERNVDRKKRAPRGRRSCHKIFRDDSFSQSMRSEAGLGNPARHPVAGVLSRAATEVNAQTCQSLARSRRGKMWT
jgi:hypothetical protein